MYLRYYGLPKARLDKYLKCAVSRYNSTKNMVNVLKHCGNLQGRNFTIVIGQCRGY